MTTDHRPTTQDWHSTLDAAIRYRLSPFTLLHWRHERWFPETAVKKGKGAALLWDINAIDHALRTVRPLRLRGPAPGYAIALGLLPDPSSGEAA